MSVTTIPYPDSLPNPYGISLIHLFHQDLPSVDRSHGMLKVGLLGPVQVQRPDGTLVEGPLWRRAKVRGLLAILALHRGRIVPRDCLLDVLWPELDRTQGLSNLNTTCDYLRRCLEPDLQNAAASRFVRQACGNYFLANWGGIELDLEQLEDGIRRASMCHDTVQAIGLLVEALAQVRGPFLQYLWQL